MADSKVSALASQSSPLGTDEVYLARSSDSSEYRLSLARLLGDDGAWVNLVKNSPGQIVTDGVEPQWWDDSGSGTITDEDAAGEGIADKTERVFKVVTTGDDHYGYGTATFADESLLDAGQTVVSFSCWVYCASASKASIGIYGSNLGLEESSQHSGGGSWELLTIENITLDAADTSIQYRLIVDTGTAYFTMPMLNVGSKALPWVSRGMIQVQKQLAEQVGLAATGDIAWSDADATANTDPLAVWIQLRLYVNDDANPANSLTCSHDDIFGGDVVVVEASDGPAFTYGRVCGVVQMNDTQIFRYKANEVDADSDMLVYIHVISYWRWAP